MRIVQRLAPQSPVATGRVIQRLTKKAEGIDGKPPFIPNGEHVVNTLSTADRKPEKSRLFLEWMNVSNLVNGACPRAKLLAVSNGLSGVEVPRAADRLLWAIGKAVEAHIRETLIECHGMKAFMGTWTCACGKTEHSGFGDDKLRCPHCKTRVNTYSEYLAKHHDYLLTGSPDLVVKFGEALTVMEIKSIKVDKERRTSTPEFHSLAAPIRKHVLQALLYRMILMLLGHPVTDEVIIIYGAKDYIMKRPYKAFTVNATDENNVLACDDLLDEAYAFAEAFKAKTLTPRLSVCSSPNTRVAKECPCCSLCFSKP